MDNLPVEVLEEIKRNDIGSCQVLPLDHEAVTLAVAYLMQESMQEMARHLRQLAQDGSIRMGAFDGFVAANAPIDGREYIFLSNRYPEYNNTGEIIASLAGETGAAAIFNRSPQENETRGQKALEWFNAYKLGLPSLPSVIAVAVQIKERKNKEQFDETY